MIDRTRDLTKPNEEAARRAAASDGRVTLSRQSGDEELKTGQGGASPPADREFLFEYRFGGSTWSITIFARNPAEAREKIKSVALAQYKGEQFAKIKVPGGGWLRRLLGH